MKHCKYNMLWYNFLAVAVKPSTSTGHNHNQMQTVALSTSYKVYRDSFLPRSLIHDAGIVAQDVYSSKCFCSFLEGSLREREENGNQVDHFLYGLLIQLPNPFQWGVIHHRAVTISQLINYSITKNCNNFHNP